MATSTEIETYIIDDDDEPEAPELDEEENRFYTINSTLDKQIAQDMEAIRNYISEAPRFDPLKKRIEFFNSMDTSYIDRCVDKTVDPILCQHTGLGTLKWHTCNQCDFKTETKEQLRQHVIIKHTQLGKLNWYVCQHCEFVCPQEADMAKHTKGAHENKCTECGEVFITEPHLLRHRAHKHGLKIFDCKKCEFVTKTSEDFTRHTLTHAKLNFSWYKCERCEYRTVKKSNLDRHISHKHSFF
ncbi:RE1-silencing transcription factor-like Protein [Tribolium castaneum]|uniref:RE1-silencing transcription factor-like Protein n=1 Tax=Tribolium castaneum TaxID=7070 RepID=A0A139WDE9_TRICA|nr:PREDICTED: RE1-silencing transcription factor B [Tribolium castaneum]KYB25956.1 RE1-silencing transcription factor-like Protein [Tribolium castaneum]|eukprot:XP_008196959.1 PREDICTED: RE1-silencing transcription factor B [Tribolium castaneum]